jgi:hypothetical protein
VPRFVLLPALLAALAVAACGGDDTVALSEAEACKAVEERLDLEEIENRFGEPDGTQDFFGDTVASYDRGDVKWQFQVRAEGGTFRVLRQRGAREEIIDCPR